MRIFTLPTLIAAVLVLEQYHSAKQPFTIVATAENQTVKAGSSVLIKVNLTNTSTQDLDASASISDLTGIDPNFIFDVRDGTGNLVSKRVYEHPELATGHAILDRVIKPGESLTQEMDISRLCDMSRPGQYVIQVSRRVLEVKTSGGVKSNKVTVNVTL